MSKKQNYYLLLGIIDFKERLVNTLLFFKPLLQVYHSKTERNRYKRKNLEKMEIGFEFFEEIPIIKLMQK